MPLSSESDLPCPGSHSHSQEERNERKKEISSLHLSLSVVLLCFSLATKHGLLPKVERKEYCPMGWPRLMPICWASYQWPTYLFRMVQWPSYQTP
jgi:hypothetical protein